MSDGASLGKLNLEPTEFLVKRVHAATITKRELEFWLAVADCETELQDWFGIGIWKGREITFCKN